MAEPLTSVGIAADLGFFEPPTNNPLIQNGNIGLIPKSVIEPGTVTFPVSITFNQRGQIIGAVSGQQTGMVGVVEVGIVSPNKTLTISNTPITISGDISVDLAPVNTLSPNTALIGYQTVFTFNNTGQLLSAEPLENGGLVPQSVVADYGYIPVVANAEPYISFTSSALSIDSCVLIQPVGASALATYIGVKPEISSYNISGNQSSASSAVTVYYSNSANTPSGFYWAIINPSSNIFSYVRPTGIISLSNVNSNALDIDCTSYGITPSPKAAYFLNVTTVKSSDSVFASLVANTTPNHITVSTTGICNIDVLVIDVDNDLIDSSNCVMLKCGNITAPASSYINNTSCLEVPTLVTTEGTISCFSSIIVPAYNNNMGSCCVNLCGHSTQDSSSWAIPDKGLVMSYYAFPKTTTTTGLMPLLGAYYVNIFKKTVE